MSTMIERVAKAIEGRWHHGAINSQELARVAIAAMREPTDEMVATVLKLDPEVYELDVRNTWDRMIDAAIHGPVPATADPVGFDLPQGEME
jgi:hypothetical protein